MCILKMTWTTKKWTEIENCSINRFLHSLERCSNEKRSDDENNVGTVGGIYKYAVAILEEEVNLVIRVMWASKVSLRDHTMNVLIDTFYDTLNSVF